MAEFNVTDITESDWVGLRLLSVLLIPARDEQARHEVNWMYWKYLAGEAA